MRKKRFLSILALLCLTVSSAWAQGPWTSGNCTVTLSNGTMTVSGNGAMADYGSEEDRPWHDYSSNITSLVVESGVTTIGSRAFYNCTALTSVTLPEGLTAINVCTFYGCSGLTTLTIPSTVTSIDSNDAFFICTSMTDVYLYADPANLTWPEDGDDFQDNNATNCHVLAEHLAAYQSNFPEVNVTFVGDLQPQAPAAAATENVTITFNDFGLENAYDLTSGPLTVGNIELSFDKADGSNPPAFYTTGGGTARIYKGNTMSISAGGATITKIVFTYASDVTPAFSTGSYNATTKTWEGEATTLTLINAYTTNTQIRIKSMDVYYSVASAAEPAAYTVTLKEGTEDADNWTITPEEAKTTGVAAGTEITATYSGTKRVKSVKAVKKVTLADPLTMEALTAGNIEVNISGNFSTGMKYSVNGGAKTLINTTTTIDVAAGDKVQFYGNGTSTQAYGNYPVYVTLLGTAQTKAYGNIMSLLDEDNFATLTALPNQGYVFYGLFKNNANLTDASGLLLPATTLTKQCYCVMFLGCSSLTAAPALPATTLAEACYSSMFSGCSSLTSAPALPATTLANGCYNSMFSNCSTLVAAPALPATTLDNSCYAYMFEGCSSLTAAPALPATTLDNNCYYQMFNGCSSLTAAPVLPATTLAVCCYQGMFQGCTGLTTVPADLLKAETLANNCYQGMFSGCTSLTAVPADFLPATTLVKYCYRGMFQGCTSLTAAPVLPAHQLVNNCYNSMFKGCSNLASITCLAYDISNSSCTTDWVSGVAENGTFYKYSGTDWTSKTGTAGIPANWDVQDAPSN